MDGRRGRAREAPQDAVSGDDVGRVISEAALSKHPRGTRSRPIIPQDEIAENDSPTPESTHALRRLRNSQGCARHRSAASTNRTPLAQAVPASRCQALAISFPFEIKTIHHTRPSHKR